MGHEQQSAPCLDAARSCPRPPRYPAPPGATASPVGHRLLPPTSTLMPLRLDRSSSPAPGARLPPNDGPPTAVPPTTWTPRPPLRAARAGVRRPPRGGSAPPPPPPPPAPPPAGRPPPQELAASLDATAS